MILFFPGAGEAFSQEFKLSFDSSYCSGICEEDRGKPWWRQVASYEVSAVGEASSCFLGNENLLSYFDGKWTISIVPGVQENL